MKRIILKTGITTLVLAAGIAKAGTTESEIARNVSPLLNNVPIEKVSPSDRAGLYEIITPRGILYTDKTGSFVIFGATLVDSKTKANLTEQRLAQLGAFKFSELPLQDAIKTVKGNGKRVLVTFEDPNCGYCKRLMSEINKIDNVTVYTFLIPILSPDSEVKAKAIWCSPERARTWVQLMSGGGGMLQPAAPDCDTPLQRNLALSRKLRITGTPALLFADDTKINGYKPAAEIEAKLGE
ncbi:DsbC family protein [Massilia aerilata]|uniref:Thiol:disulfide interchange protein n=1 Tax=Massilia aerilata TaxID=453817 RepID=A0ABW0RZH6_9BURK